MVRAVLKDGAIQLLDPLPADWHEGMVLRVKLASEAQDRTSAPDEDHEIARGAIEEHRRESKDVDAA